MPIALTRVSAPECDTTMTEPQLHHQTRLWLAATSTEVRKAIQQEATRLRTEVEERIAALETVVSANDSQLDQVAANVIKIADEMALEAVGRARQEIEAATQATLQAIRTEFESTRVALEAQLAETESEVSALRQKRDEYATTLKGLRERLATLEQASGQATLRRELAEARLDEEVQRRVAFEKQLETSRQELVLAKAEAESSRLEAHLATDRLRVFETSAPPARDVQAQSVKKAVVAEPVAPLPQRVPDSQPAGSQADVSEFSVNRQARRIKIEDGDVLVDGVASVLVDISALGAQVLSPTTLRPNRVVRLMLRTGTGTCTAEGRIVWAQLESSNADIGAQYRAGMQFTALNRAAITELVGRRDGVLQAAAPSSSYR
jgi:hypothetical protein